MNLLLYLEIDHVNKKEMSRERFLKKKKMQDNLKKLHVIRQVPYQFFPLIIYVTQCKSFNAANFYGRSFFHFMALFSVFHSYKELSLYCSQLVHPLLKFYIVANERLFNNVLGRPLHTILILHCSARLILS